jgi:hypothetical protein
VKENSLEISYGMDVVFPHRAPCDPRPVVQVVWVVHDPHRKDKVLLIGQGSNDYSYSVENRMAYVFSSREMNPPELITGWYIMKYTRKGETLCKSDLFYYDKQLI